MESMLGNRYLMQKDSMEVFEMLFDVFAEHLRAEELGLLCCTAFSRIIYFETKRSRTRMRKQTGVSVYYWYSVSLSRLTMTILREHGVFLGLGVLPGPNGGLSVAAIDRKGIVGGCIKVGDLITEVNGKKDDAVEMFRELQCAKRLSIVICDPW